MKLFGFLLDTAETPAGDTPNLFAQIFSAAIPILLLVVVFYFFLYRPQKKQEKSVNEMRSSIEPGDVIVTAGGLVGVVIRIKDDMILLESGADKTKFQIQKWAVRSILSKGSDS